MLRYVSLFSGIEAATHAWHPLGWHCVAVAEIEPFPSHVLAHHYPNTPNLGDVTLLTEDDVKRLGQVDVLVFGSHANGGGHLAVATRWEVRRLTPRECERLQGFRDDFTAVPDAKGKPAADGPRYKALGNSMAVPVMQWIGKSIEFAHLYF